MIKLVDKSKITTLNLLGNSLDEEVIKEIFIAISNKQEKVLKELNLSHNFITNEMDEDDLWNKLHNGLGSNNSLEFLSLSDMDITDSGLEKVVNALKGSNIQGLNIDNYGGIGQTTIQALPGLLESSKLRFLSIANCGGYTVKHPSLEIKGLFNTLKGSIFNIFRYFRLFS
ncbi:leucine-rich repeat domain-containing protein [Wolbachia endosymbiont of Frankliniella intonsa]|uniref:hypothetical protein n=1 Tax=Wolbachia endosymbiont of Frankliniella intonsa TaxID=2902422 RepID=UPI00244EA47A|nr:hypothetical protein [Wolbachia endosymbiont of Frankliniella intonsa]WGJ61853.1 hypothetical protein M3L71_06055 [Wolbachia endosymbiont of Frankliniella intonsa]